MNEYKTKIRSNNTSSAIYLPESFLGKRVTVKLLKPKLVKAKGATQTYVSMPKVLEGEHVLVEIE